MYLFQEVVEAVKVEGMRKLAEPAEVSLLCVQGHLLNTEDIPGFVQDGCPGIMIGYGGG